MNEEDKKLWVKCLGDSDKAYTLAARFAEVIRADEREACAALCNDIANKHPDLSVRFAAHAIRARGTP